MATTGWIAARFSRASALRPSRFHLSESAGRLRIWFQHEGICENGKVVGLMLVTAILLGKHSPECILPFSRHRIKYAFGLDDGCQNGMS